ncbi:MAG: hypothetical protein IKV79_03695 [Oscillospiraceae bacterium]|nr:hypothetical protein [Oscillospiraceae bacterium]
MEEYPCTLFLSREGYFKKITPQSLRMSSEQKYKENDSLKTSFESNNRNELLIFTDKQQVYKCRVSDFEDTKASVLGVYLPTKLGMDEGENVLEMIDPGDYSKQLLLFFENGKCARVTLESYATKTNRKRLTGAYSDKSPLRTVMLLEDECQIACFTTEGRALVFNTALIQPKTSRSTQGVGIMNIKSKWKLDYAERLEKTTIQNVARYRVRSVPALGALLKEEDRGEEQMSLL